MLHGAGGAEPPVEQIVTTAAQHGVAVLIPKSRQNTWDAALGGLGEDVVHINRALEETFKRVRVDPNRVALAGFSDGASYALTLGIANGDLFSHVIAFAPGFITPVNRYGQPDILIVHGTQDGVTSSRNTRENIVPFLRALGYAVLHHEFEGAHQVNAPESEFALDWFIANGS
jgi:phospholipase/carboxylesterase